MAICTSQGLLCPNLYTWNMMQSYVLIIVRFCLTSLVIYISLFKATCDNFRRFVLNLYTACVAYETVLIIYTALNVYLLFAEWNLQFAKLLSYWVTILEYAQLLVNYQYRLLSLFLILLYFLPISLPLFYKRYLMKRCAHFWLFVLIANILCLSYSIPHIYIEIKGTALNTTQVNRIMNGVEIFNATVVCALTVAAILITALAFFILVHYHGMTVPRGVQKKLLISLFLYCIPLNILNAPNSVDSFLLIIASMNPANEATLSNYYPSNSFVESYCNRVRTIVISLCTLLVIPSYRASLLSMFVHSSRNTRIVQPETSHTVNKRAPVYVYTLSMNLPRQSAVESRAIGRHI